MYILWGYKIFIIFFTVLLLYLLFFTFILKIRQIFFVQLVLQFFNLKGIATLRSCSPSLVYFYVDLGGRVNTHLFKFNFVVLTKAEVRIYNSIFTNCSKYIFCIKEKLFQSYTTLFLLSISTALCSIETDWRYNINFLFWINSCFQFALFLGYLLWGYKIWFSETFFFQVYIVVLNVGKVTYVKQVFIATSNMNVTEFHILFVLFAIRVTPKKGLSKNTFFQYTTKLKTYISPTQICSFF